MNTIGHITLNLSAIAYLLWFIPQILLNSKRKNTQGLSTLMVGILILGCLCDLMYGFGMHLPWQYRAVTIVGLGTLAIQNYQIGRYGLRKISEKYGYIALNFVYMSVLIYAIYTLTFHGNDENFYNAIGMLTNVCWLSYALPQIVKNYRNKSTEGFSTQFVIMGIFLNICDATSAWTLGWSYPAKIGPAIAFIKNSILLFQVFYYGMRAKSFTKLAVNC